PCPPRAGAAPVRTPSQRSSRPGWCRPGRCAPARSCSRRRWRGWCPCRRRPHGWRCRGRSARPAACPVHRPPESFRSRCRTSSSPPRAAACRGRSRPGWRSSGYRAPWGLRAFVGTVTVPQARFPGRESTRAAANALPFVTGAGTGRRARLAPSRPDGDNPMKHPLAMALALALAATSLHAQAQDATPVAATAEQSNPFFAESPLPLHYPQFDRIKDSDFAPAFDRGMAEQLAEIAAIADNPAPPTFDNTIVAMEKSGQVFNRAASVFFNLVGADTNDAREKLRAEYAPKFSAHSDAIRLNAKLFARIKTLHDGLADSGLDAQDTRLVEKYYEDFVRAGANLSDADKARLKEMNAELARLATTFS